MKIHLFFSWKWMNFFFRFSWILGISKKIEFDLKSKVALECARRYITYLLTFDTVCDFGVRTKTGGLSLIWPLANNSNTVPKIKCVFSNTCARKMCCCWSFQRPVIPSFSSSKAAVHSELKSMYYTLQNTHCV